MSVLAELAASLGRADEQPNVVLAERLAKEQDTEAIAVVVDGLTHKAAIASDCIKVLYEVAEREPSLLIEHFNTLLGQLHHKNNRHVWGAMTALDALTLTMPAQLAKHLPTIVAVADRGSVITRDHAVGILTKLCTLPTYRMKAFPFLLDLLRKCPTNQLAMYAEMTLPIATTETIAALLEVLAARLPQLPKVSQQNRVNGVLRKYTQQLERD